MNKNVFKHQVPALETLRTRVEKCVYTDSSGAAAPPSIEDLRIALEELEIYRAELEMQNEELRLNLAVNARDAMPGMTPEVQARIFEPSVRKPCFWQKSGEKRLIC
jgi:hypothetical protein